VGITIIGGCAGTQHLKEGEYLLYKQHIVAAKQIDSDGLKQQLAQHPNRRLLFLPISLYTSLYYQGLKNYDTAKYSAKKDRINARYDLKTKPADIKPGKLKRLNSRRNKKIAKVDKTIKEGNQFMRWGEPVAVLDSGTLRQTVVNMENYLQSKGWFNGRAFFNTRLSNRQAHITFNLQENQRYFFDTLFYQVPDTSMFSLIKQNDKKSLISAGNPYDSDILGKERDRLDALFKNNGYFNFSKQYITYQVDTAHGDHQVAVRMLILLPEKKSRHPVFTVDSVIFTTDATSQDIDAVRQHTVYNNITYQYFKRKYSEKVLNRRVSIKPGELYSKSNTLHTQQELARMDNFKFVNVNYDTTGGKFVANIFVSPLERYQWSNEAGLSVTQGYPGPFLSMSLKRRNIFSRLGTFEIDARLGVEGVAAASNPDDILASTEAGGNVGVTFPQFFLPLSDENKKRLGFFNPKTNVKAGVTYTTRPEYTRFEVRGTNSYSWTTKKNNKFVFKLLDVGLIRTPKMDSLYLAKLQELEANGNNLINSFKPSVVSSMNLTSVTLTNNYGTSLQRSSYFSYSIEPGGTLTNLWGQSYFGKRELEIYAYFKLNIDYRKMLPAGKNKGWAYKLSAGIAIPYGPNKLLPYEKYFFAGGSISNRAWKTRRLGPGSYNHLDENGLVTYQFEQTGEIILETSLEFRQRLFRLVQGAFFIDAGNIWTINEDPARRGAKFDINSFYQEIAIGSGLGLRLDFSFLLVRLDVGLKVYDPARPLGKRFILSQGFNDEPYHDPLLTEPVIWTLAIGYPF
jgi:hypothetical protein